MEPVHDSAFRLFNGFAEGWPDLVVDIYGTTAVLYDYAEMPDEGASAVRTALEFVQIRLPWVHAAVVKIRNGQTSEDRAGKLLFGTQPSRRIKEHGVWYAVDLQLSQDAGLYLDTRNLRRWALDHLMGKSVLNAFSYTGSLGVAALAGGASRVAQLDRSRRYLEVAKASSKLNGFPIRAADFVQADFFRQAAKFRRKDERFDCVFLDPPYFSAGAAGIVDQANAGKRLLNKARPLVGDGGYLVAVNNALFVSGREYMRTLESVCSDGYLNVREIIRIPDDVTGYPETRLGDPITDPSPFNHSTKIAILEVRRKGG